MENVHTVSMMHHIPQQPCQTGQVKAGMARRLKPGSNTPLNFNLLEKQLQKTLQDTMQVTLQDVPNDSSIEMDLMKGLHDLTLKET